MSPAGISGTRGPTVAPGLSDMCGVFLFCGYWSRASHACARVCAVGQGECAGGLDGRTMPVTRASCPAFSFHICLRLAGPAHPGAGAHQASHIQAEALTLGD